MTPASLELKVGLVNGSDAAFLKLAEELREVLLLDVEVDAVDEGHGGFGVLPDERGREDLEDLFLKPGRPVAVAETRHCFGLERFVRVRDLIALLHELFPLLGGDAAPELAPSLRVERIVEARDIAGALGRREDDAVVRGADPVNELGWRGAFAVGIDADVPIPHLEYVREVFARVQRLVCLDDVIDAAFHGALDALLQRASGTGLERDDPGVFHRATSRPSRRTASTNAEAPSKWSTSEPSDHSASEPGPTRRSSHAAPSRVRGVT